MSRSQREPKEPKSHTNAAFFDVERINKSEHLLLRCSPFIRGELQTLAERRGFATLTALVSAVMCAQVGACDEVVGIAETYAVP